MENVNLGGYANVVCSKDSQVLAIIQLAIRFEAAVPALFYVLGVDALMNSVRMIFSVQVRRENCSLQHSVCRESQGQIAPSNSLVERTLAFSCISTRQGLDCAGAIQT